MTNLQYVGARYVPKFYENSLNPNSCDWESGVGYEPMTVVTYLGDSYTSKKPVPGTVGNPAANSEYWAKTGEFNAAILALQSKVNNIDNVEIPSLQGQIDDINNPHRKVIFIGDSYTSSMQWPEKTAAILGLTLNSSYWVRGISGEGFSVGTDNNGFLTNLKHFENIISAADKLDITDIIVLGGANDMQTSQPQSVQGGISDFYTYAQTHYPNAHVHVGFIAVAKDSVRNWNKFRVMLYAYQSCARYGKNISYLTGIEHCTHNLRTYMTDDLHPNTTMGTFFSWQLVNCLLSGGCSYSFTDQSFAYGTITFDLIIENGVGMILKNTTIPIPENTSVCGKGLFTNNFGDFTELGTTTNIYFNHPIIVDRYVQIGGVGSFPGALIFYQDKLYVTIFNSAGAWANVTAGNNSYVFNNNIYKEFDNLYLA